MEQNITRFMATLKWCPHFCALCLENKHGTPALVMEITKKLLLLIQPTRFNYDSALYRLKAISDQIIRLQCFIGEKNPGFNQLIIQLIN